MKTIYDYEGNSVSLVSESDIFNVIPAQSEVSVSDVCTNSLPSYSVDPPAETTRLTFHSYDSYNTYYFYSNKSFKLWFSDEPNADYVAVGVLDNAGVIQESAGYTGVLEVSGNNAARYRLRDSNLPSVSNKLQVSAGTLIVFTLNVGASADDVKIMIDSGEPSIDSTTLNNFLNLNEAQVDQITKNGFVEYKDVSASDGTTEKLNIYLKSEAGYVLYEFSHYEVANKNCDVWRLAYAKKTNKKFEVMDSITTNGEWECAIKIDGRSDHSGGILHGNEVYQSLSVFIDGVLTNKSAISGKIPFETLSIIQKSNLYDKNDGTTIFAEHTSLHKFEKTLRIKQSVLFKGNYTLDRGYLAMFPIAKTHSDHYFTDQKFEYTEMEIPFDQLNAKSITLFGGGTMATFTLISQVGTSADAKGLNVRDSGTGSMYNKCYFNTAVNGDTVTEDTVWQVETEYDIIA